MLDIVLIMIWTKLWTKSFQITTKLNRIFREVFREIIKFRYYFSIGKLSKSIKFSKSNGWSNEGNRVTVVLLQRFGPTSVDMKPLHSSVVLASNVSLCGVGKVSIFTSETCKCPRDFSLGLETLIDVFGGGDCGNGVDICSKIVLLGKNKSNVLFLPGKELFRFKGDWFGESDLGKDDEHELG